MKRVATTLVCLHLLALVLAPIAATGAGKPGIAVLEFQNRADLQYWWPGGAQAIQDVFIAELVKSGRFSVVGREPFNAVMREAGLTLTGDVDPSTAMQIGKLLGVEYLVTGFVTEYGKTDSGAPAGIRRLPGLPSGKSIFVAAANARVFNASTGEIVWADEARAEDSNMEVSDGGSGGGTDNDRQKFDKVMKPVVLKLVASINASDL